MPGPDASDHSPNPSNIENRRFAILQAGHSNAQCMATAGDFSDMFLRLLRQEGENWVVYNVVYGEFPTLNDIKTLSGFLITGSKYDAHGTDPWIVQLREILKTIYEDQDFKHVKILGVCFGHQVLAHSLGGESGRGECGFEGGMRSLTLHPEFKNLSYTQGITPDPVVNILEVHQDQVKSLPHGAVLLASSPNTPVEMFALGERVLGIQGHPEFTPAVVESIVDAKLAAGDLDAKGAAEAKASLGKGEASQKFLQELCLKFLKG